MFEKFFGRFIDGVVTVSKESEENVLKLFPNVPVTSVPNYIDFQQVDNTSTLAKIDSVLHGGTLRFVYFGTLNMESRETDLILWLSDNLLKKYSYIEVVMGRKTEDATLLESFSSLTVKYPGRFRYLGYIPYEQMIEETQKATFGFLFHRKLGSYWVSDASPNKFYEYLNCGVIPVVRTSTNNDMLKPEGVVCDANDSWEDILNNVEELIASPREELVRRMQGLLNKSETYRFSAVAKNYLFLYQKLIDEEKY